MTVTLSPSDIVIFLLILAAFALVFYLIRLAIAARETLKQAQALMGSIHAQVANLGDEPRRLIHKVNQISANLENKLHHTDPLFQVIGDLGDALSNKTAALKQKTERQQFKERFSTSSSEEKFNVSDLLELALSLVKIWNKAKEEK